MRLLVRAWGRGASAPRIGEAHRVLGKKTRARSRDIVKNAFGPRFLRGDPPEAWRLVRALENVNAPAEIVRPVYYWVTARSERLIYDFVVDELAALAASGHADVRADEAVAWVRARARAEGLSWSPGVSRRVAQGLLAALRDFGILEGRAAKRIAPVHLPPASFAYLAFCLWRLGAAAGALVNHPDWRLFLLGPGHVEHLFLEAHQLGHLSFHCAGRVYRIEFPAATHEEYAHVLAGT